MRGKKTLRSSGLDYRIVFLLRGEKEKKKKRKEGKPGSPPLVRATDKKRGVRKTGGEK